MEAVGAVDDVILQQLRQLGVGDVGFEGGAEDGESRVRGGEDGDVFLRREGGGEGGVGDGAGEGGEVQR